MTVVAVRHPAGVVHYTAMTVFVGGAAFAVLAASLVLRPGWPARLPVALVWVAAAAGAAVLALGEAAPTGWELLDLLGRAAVGGLVVLAAARLPAVWTLWVLAGVGAGLVLGDAGGWELAGAVGVGIALALLVAGERAPVLQAAAVAAGLGTLAHLSWPVASGASGLLAAVAIGPPLLASVRYAPRPVRQALPWAITAVVVLAIGGSVVGALAAFEAKTDVDRAVDAAVAGLDQIDADDTGPARAQLDTAATAFDSAESTLRAWWARPALLVPGVAQQSRAVATMADAGGELSRAAAASLAEVDFESLHPVQGRIDLARIGEVEQPLTRVLRSLRAADDQLAGARSPLLVSLVADRLDELAENVDDARATAETAAAALDVAPQLLGADGPRRYFVAMQTPSELRGIGGFMGSFAELVIDDGDFQLARTGRVTELTLGGSDPASRRIEGQAEFVDHWTQAPALFWGLIGFSPDFPTVGSIIAQLYPQSGGAEIDGVIALDPAGYAALLQLTGPISVPGHAEALTPENAEQILLHDQYLGEDEEDREAFLEAATRTLFERLTSGDLPSPQTISAALAPMVDGRHLQLFSSRDAEQRFFEHIGADGSVRRTEPDGIGIVGQNFNGNKIDYFLRRSLSYDVTWDPSTGVVEGSVEVRLENLAPASGLPHSVIGWGGDLSANQLPVADGENLHYLSIYSGTRLSDITVDGVPAELNRVLPDLGYEAQDLYVRIPSQGTVVVHATVRTQVEPGSRYALEVLRQGTATPDRVALRVRVPDEWRISAATQTAEVDDGTVVLVGNAETPLELEVHVDAVRRSLLERLQGQ